VTMGSLEVIETHISRIFFTEDRAYKLLKHCKTSFLDFTDRDARLEAAEQEYVLNSRLAPDVYLGLGDLVENDETTDRMIIMRRLPESRRFSNLVGQDGFASAIRAVARTIAAFHAAEPPVVDEADMATRDAVAARWEDNFSDLQPHVGSIIDAEEFAQVRALAREFLGARAGLFQSRIEQGAVRDGHGDLTAEDIFILDDGPRILDCLAFRDDFRIGDVLADIGFLAMDLHRIAGRESAQNFMSCYHEFSYEQHPASLAHHYVAYRAHVRAKVACLRFVQGDESQAELARTYHSLAHHHLGRARLSVLLVGGGPGVGKSTLAAGLSSELGWMLLQLDEIRKDIAGIGHDEHVFVAPGQGMYSPEMGDLAYAEMLRQADVLLEQGESVILDASWTASRHRGLAAELADRSGARLAEVKCMLDPEVAKQRVRERLAAGGGPSDATSEIVDYLQDAAAPWDSAIAIETSCDPEEAVANAIAEVRPT